MKRISTRLTAFLLAVALLLSCAACGGDKAEAAAMKLTKTEGTVGVSDGEGKDVEPREDLSLYSGYQVETRAESYAWIDLDSVKLTKLDENSAVEVTKDGKRLELDVVSGSLFFNITEPLEDDESMTIRTSTIAVGIRGTCGWVEQNAVALLEGKVTVTAGEQRVTITAGEMAVMTEDGTLEVAELSAGDLPAFVRAEVEDDRVLMSAVSGDGADGPTPPEGPAGPSDERITGQTTWALDLATGILTISGRGDMEDCNIGESPWYDNWEAIQSVVIEPGVTSIGNSAFYGCKNLTSVDVPDSVTSIGVHAFQVCSSLTGIEIPGRVTSIGAHAFSNCLSLTEVTLPDGVTSIGNNAFDTCRALTSVAIPDSVTSIGDHAFDSCSALTDVTIPDSVTSIGNSAFFGCAALTSMDIPNSVTLIGESTFFVCRGLTSVTIPEGVTSIGNQAFCGCDSLTSVEIPSSVTSIGYLAFDGCYSLTEVRFLGNPDPFNSIEIDDGNDILQEHYVP